MTLDSAIVPIFELDLELEEFLTKRFGTSTFETNHIQDKIGDFVKPMKKNLWTFVEYPYTDKVFRDSYYNYFSSKSNDYHRHCIRIAFFSEKITYDDFRNIGAFEFLQNSYLGFLVIRPLNNPIGRNLISPKAFKENHIAVCTARFFTSIDGKLLHIDGFPHISQDSETHSCAESTIWSTMEYFSHKYSEYRPVLPSNIIKTLQNISYERQIPSSGLSSDYISYALKEYGFGSKIYSDEEYSEHGLNQIISIYIESGIPIIIGIKSTKIGHAVICIGRDITTYTQIDAIKPTIDDDIDVQLFDVHNIDRQFIFIDDNYPTYQKANLCSPSEHYGRPEWKECKIFCAIVPLHPKIYLEAFNAKNAIYSIIKNYRERLEMNDNILLRYFLASSRSFKDKVLSNSTFTDEIINIVTNIALPKFIWVCELSTKELYKNKLCEGLMIIDATEPNTLNIKPLIFFGYRNKFINFASKLEDNEDLLLDKLNFNINFSAYESNLTTYL